MVSAPVSNNDDIALDSSDSSGSSDSFDSEILKLSASWNVSDYIQFTGPLIEAEETNHKFRIYIDDGRDDDNTDYTWETTVAENEWASGNGTASDPFVIENLYVNGQGEGGILYIRRAGRPFIIRNCWFNYTGGKPHGDGEALKFRNVNRGNITNNIISYANIAMAFHHTRDNIISNNIIIGDHTTAGLSVGLTTDTFSNDNTFRNNKWFNLYNPASIYDSDRVIFEGNYFTNTLVEKYISSPIHTRKSNNNTIVRNSFAGAYAYADFSIGMDSTSIGNTIENNTVVTNITAISVPIVPGISTNAPRVQQNEADLFTLADSSYNTISHNRIIREVADPDTDETTDKGISGYNFFVVFGIIGLISLVMIKKRLKRLRH